MGSVCGKHAKRGARYELGAVGASPGAAESQSVDQPLKKAKAAESQQAGSNGGHSSTAEEQIKACRAPAASKQQKPDPKDFMFMNLKRESRLKPPGSINGQQFIIDTCEGCDLYVMDACAMVTVDDCKDCRIFIGPTESSIFMRNCTNCKVACITRQLRTRDCHSCDILLMSRTRPIIESSTDIGLGCYSTPYAGLAQQMVTAKLNPFHNFWSDVFDFTPAAGAAGPQQQRNWKLLPAGMGVAQLMQNKIPEQVMLLLQQQEASAESQAVGTAGGKTGASAMSRAGTTEVALSEFFRSSASSPEAPVTAPLPATATDSQSASGPLGSAAAGTAGSGAAAAAAPEKLLSEDAVEVMFDSDGNGPEAADSQTAAAAAQPEETGTAQDGPTATVGAAISPATERTEPTEADIQSVIATAGELCDVQEIQEGCFAFLLFLPGHREAVLQWVVKQFPCRTVAGEASGSSALLLRCNEAAIPTHIMKELSAAAGWAKDQVKPLTAAAQQQKACIGLEVKCSSIEQQKQLAEEVKGMSGVCSSSLQAAKLFRNLGTDG